MASATMRLPERVEAVKSLTLHEQIPALQLVATEEGQARFGPLIRLPRGAELQEFGEGFDEKTVLVRSGTTFYVVFQQDLTAAQRSGRPQRARVQTA